MDLFFKAGKERLEEGVFYQTNDGLPRACLRFSMHESNQELVKQGWCWWYRKYAPGDAVLEGSEKVARAAKRGLWVDPQPVPPWEWRKRSR
jgi:endonuclease YncB( thermonuclease family)